MKTILLCFIVSFISVHCLSQIKFSDEAKKFIEYNDSILIFKDALLIDGKGNPAKAHQTIIIRNGKIDWLGDDGKAMIVREQT